MALVSATVTIDVSLSRAFAFEFNVPIDLTTIFTGYWPLPAVAGTKNQTGAWNAPGQTRTVLLSDGSSSQEKLTSYEHPTYFSYAVGNFTGTLGHLVATAKGEWWFTETSPNKTHVKWRYAFTAKSAATMPVLWLITKTLWRDYMRKAVRLFKEQAELEAAQGNLTLTPSSG